MSGDSQSRWYGNETPQVLCRCPVWTLLHGNCQRANGINEDSDSNGRKFKKETLKMEVNSQESENPQALTGPGHFPQDPPCWSSLAPFVCLHKGQRRAVDRWRWSGPGPAAGLQTLAAKCEGWSPACHLSHPHLPQWHSTITFLLCGRTFCALDTRACYWVFFTSSSWSWSVMGAQVKETLNISKALLKNW